MNETLKHVMDDIDAELTAIIAAVNTASISKGNKERRDFRAIKQETGISSSWLSLFADGGIKEPGHKRTKLLAAWLRMNGFLAAEQPDDAMDTPTRRVLVRRGLVSPGAHAVSCSGGGHV